MSVTIQVPWQDPYTHKDAWNELLAWTVEVFGLPGERVTFHPTASYMEFVFDDEQDALAFQIKTGGIVVSHNDLAIRHVGSFLG
jgi:hypothetical protein